MWPEKSIIFELVTKSHMHGQVSCVLPSMPILVMYIQIELVQWSNITYNKVIQRMMHVYISLIVVKSTQKLTHA